MKILLATDDGVSRTLLRRTLERSGFEVQCAGDGQSAIEALLSPRGPRMAILDWVLPLQDGLNVCRQVRACKSIAPVYLILLTSRTTAEDVVTGFDAGVDDYLTKPCNPSELKARIRVGERALQLQDSLLHEAEHDPLTGLPNRAFFVKRLAVCTRKAQQDDGYQFALLFVDVDRFKMINDSLGHLMGDALMKEVSQRLLHAVRRESSGSPDALDRHRASSPGDVVARIGGDEFVILLDEFAGVDEGVLVAKRIQKSLESPFMVAEHKLFITASIGISTSGGAATEASDILRGADAAMYKAKSLGKACYVVDDASDHAAAAGLLKLESDLRRALENEEFEVFYQPIVDLSDRRIVSFEALLRWNHPELGLLQPSSFISLAEESGLIVPLGKWVLRRAARQMQQWNEPLDPSDRMSVCVNISPQQFRDGLLIQEVRGVLLDTSLDPSALELEVTENLTMQDAGWATQVLRDLSQLGISISLDDFGTGYSSLSYLRRLPIRTLKIDRSFTAELESSREGTSIVETIVDLGHNLGMKVIAEGIETVEQLSILEAAHCDFGQGYLFSRPVNAAAATAMLSENLPHEQFAFANHGELLGEARSKWVF